MGNFQQKKTEQGQEQGEQYVKGNVELKKEFERQFLNDNIKLEPEQIFRFLISTRQEDIDSINNSRSNKKTVCGGQIEQNQLCFQCFTCAPDPHHVFCARCFDRQKHKSFNHHCIMKYDIAGCCDCGDNKTIIESAFCENHCGILMKTNLQIEINQNVQEKIREYIRLGFLRYFRKIEKNLLMAQILNIYEKDNAFISDLKGKYEQYFSNLQRKIKNFKKAFHYQNILFTMIRWLCNQNMSAILLITQTLLDPIPDHQCQNIKLYHDCESGQLSYHKDASQIACRCTILSNILRNATFLEYGPTKPKDVEDVFYLFHANDNFKKQLLETILQQYVHLQRKEKNFISDSQNRLDFTLQNQKQVGYFPTYSIINNKSKLLQDIQSCFNEQEQTENKQHEKLFFCKPEIHSHHTQYVSFEYQSQFFNSPHLRNLYNNLQETFNLLTEIQFDNLNSMNNCSYIFKLRMDYSFHGELSYQLLQNIKINNINETAFTINDLDDQIYVNAFLNHHPIPCLMNCYQQQKPLSLNLKLWTNHEEKIHYLLNYIHTINNQISLVKLAYQKLVNYNQELTLPITKILLKYAYTLLVSRNQAPTYYNSKIEEMEYLQSLQVSLNNLEDQLIINASICDKLFGFFLTSFYFLNQNLSLNNLIELLNVSKEIFQENIELAVSRAIQSFSCCLRDPYGHISNIYSGKIYQCDYNSQSGDFALIKLYLLLFKQNGVEFILKESLNQSFKQQKNFRYKLFLMILLNDLEFINLSSIFNFKLDINGKTFLRKILLSLFLIHHSQTFDELKEMLTQMGLLKSIPLQQYIFEDCVLDPYIKKLKLKPSLYNYQIYEPFLFEDVKNIQSKLVEKVMSIESIDQNLGNAIEYEFQKKNNLNIIGPLRSEILKSCLNCQEFIDFIIEKQIHTSQQNFKNQVKLLLTCYQFTENNEQKNFFRDEYNKIKIDYHANQDKQQNSFYKEDNLAKFYQVADKILFQEKIISQEDSPQKKLKQQQKMALLKQQFLLKSESFMKQQQEESNESIEEVCLSCKLPFDNSKAMPALIIMTDSHKYLDTYTEKHNFLNIHLYTCGHEFHQNCLQKQINFNSALPIWTVSCCPVCKNAMNCQLDKSSYWDTIIQICNTNEHAAEKYYNSDQVIDEDLIFLQIQLSILGFLILENKNIEQICDLIKYSINQKQEKLLKMQLYLKKFEDETDSLKNEIVRIFNNLLSDNRMPLQINSLQLYTIEQMSEQYTKTLGNNFNDFYQKYFTNGCSKCSQYPKYSIRKDGIKQNKDLFVCLLCKLIFCSYQCDPNKNQQEHGNLNLHAVSHKDNCAYISLSSGQILLVSTPISIRYRKLFFNNIGQCLNYNQNDAKWEEYLLDKRILTEVCEQIKFQRIQHTIRSMNLAGSLVDNQGML